MLRHFCRVYLQVVPDDTTLLRWAQLIQPQTLAQLNDHVVDRARKARVTRGRKLRIDSTVVEGNPPDAPQFQHSLDAHRRRFGRAPRLLAADRGFWAPDSDAMARQAGVTAIAIPHQGPAPPERRQ